MLRKILCSQKYSMFSKKSFVCRTFFLFAKKPIIKFQLNWFYHSLKYLNISNTSPNCNFQYLCYKHEIILTRLNIFCIHSSIKHLCDTWLAHCYNIQNVSFIESSNLISIGNCVFLNSNIQTLIISIKIQSFGKQLCCCTNSLKSVTFDHNNKYYFKNIYKQISICSIFLSLNKWISIEKKELSILGNPFVKSILFNVLQLNQEFLLFFNNNIENGIWMA